MNALIASCFALIGAWEVIVIFTVLLTMAAVAAAVICLIVALAIRRRATPVSALSNSPASGTSGTAVTAKLTSSTEKT